MFSNERSLNLYIRSNLLHLISVFKTMCCILWWLSVLCSCLCVCCSQHTKDIETYREYGGSLDLQDAFDVLYSEPCKSMPKVQYLMKVFNANCPNITSFFPMMVRKKRHIFVAIEGTHKETKLIISKMLARSLGGKFKFSPPYFLVNTGQKYTENKVMSRAFYCLGYYATAYEAAMLLPNVPVVTGGYWMDQLAFGVVAAFTEGLPTPDSPVYTWPRDLLKPDVIFFLNLPSHNLKNTFTEADPLNFRSKLIQFYRIWGSDPPVVEINTTNVHRDVIRLQIRYIEQKLGYVGHLLREEQPPHTDSPNSYY